MARRGGLTLGHRSVDIGELLQVALDRFGRPAAMFEARGMGFKDGGEDVRAFRRACADGNVTPTRSPLLKTAMAEAWTMTEPAGKTIQKRAGRPSVTCPRQCDGGHSERLILIHLS